MEAGKNSVFSNCLIFFNSTFYLKCLFGTYSGYWIYHLDLQSTIFAVQKFFFVVRAIIKFQMDVENYTYI